MATTRFSGYTASFTHAGGTLSINQLSGATLSPNQRFDEIFTSGSVDRLATILGSAMPMVTIPTGDLELLGTISALTGLACTGTSRFYLQKRADSGIFAAGSVHTQILSALGFLCPQSISASGDQLAAMQLAFWPLWNGTTPPFSVGNSVALSGTAPAYNSKFYLGPVLLDGNQLEGCISASVDFGIGFQPVIADGDLYPRIGSIVSRSPVFRLEFLKCDMINATLTSMFHSGGTDELAVWFRKGVSGGTRVDDYTTGHLKVAASAFSWGPDQVAFAGETDATVAITVRPHGPISFSFANIFEV